MGNISGDNFGRDFCVQEREDLLFVSYSPWTDQGIVHGFFGKSPFSRNPRSNEYAADYGPVLGLEQLLLLDQVHGEAVLDLRAIETLNLLRELSERGRPYPKAFQADAALVGRGGEKLAIGVVTADCLPLIMRCGDDFAVVHAGWRGLGKGVIEKALEIITRNKDGLKIEAVIGPCAGKDRYEVGSEVVDYLGANADCSDIGGGKYRLSVSGTAKKILTQAAAGKRLKIADIGVCTISNHDYHSYRRDGQGAGRNLAFLVF